jgi:hypothetical protein
MNRYPPDAYRQLYEGIQGQELVGQAVEQEFARAIGAGSDPLADGRAGRSCTG